MRQTSNAIGLMALIGLGLLFAATALNYGPLYTSGGVFIGAAFTLWRVKEAARHADD